MVKAIRKPPSRVRYEQSHPVVSCRLDRETYQRLKARLAELEVSFADFVKDALGSLEVKLTDNEKRDIALYEAGCKDTEELCEIWYFCAVCGKRIDMSPDGNDHKAMIGYMKKHGWGHASCHRQ